ncbi:hypothetical protein GOQ27_08555 [Clostridium sp. D2Q-11]|uniref:Uncharacterized protein n=1 Tax=Anaeromonas frigoriresistens TaxID=2683708 RepID=A0A942UTX1_9FIRM|nr:hypothetical protein [Anaeromonas frigoriresistens]MBS4538513.1 hypothetical protein [Anaeromonas frigoriresistens]
MNFKKLAIKYFLEEADINSLYLEILNNISPIIGSYILNTTKKDFSPYPKIDVSITDSIDTKISNKKRVKII